MEFKGKRVLLIGAGHSAEDVALQCYKNGVDHVIISWRHKPLQYKFPPKIDQKPLLIEVTGKTAKFRDGSKSEVDVIILCTGYKYGYSFLEDSLQIVEPIACCYPENLYKGLVWLKGGNRKLFYMGANLLVTALPLIDAQAVWVVTYIMGRSPVSNKDLPLKKLHPTNEEIQDYLDRIRREIAKISDTPTLLRCRKYYIHDIVDDTGYDIDVDTVTDCVEQCVRDRTEHVLAFRDFQFVSAYTGRKAESPTTTWINNFGETNLDVL